MGDEYPKFPKIPRLDTEFWITEKIDGSNGLIYISDTLPFGGSLELGGGSLEGISVFFSEELDEEGFPVGEHAVRAGSRKQWISPQQDNFGFAAWVHANAKELVTALGPGHHYGEWYGSGINRGYGLTKGEKRFMLLHVFRWHENPPQTDLVEVATVLDKVPGGQLAGAVWHWEEILRSEGSRHVPGYDRPEGVVAQNRANREIFFKYPFDKPAPKLDLQSAQPRVQALGLTSTPHIDAIGVDARGTGVR